jgi:hypothetical protein
MAKIYDSKQKKYVDEVDMETGEALEEIDEFPYVDVFTEEAEQKQIKLTKFHVHATENYQAIDCDVEVEDISELGNIIWQLREAIKVGTPDIEELKAKKIEEAPKPKKEEKPFIKASPAQINYLKNLGVECDWSKLSREAASQKLRELGR